MKVLRVRFKCKDGDPAPVKWPPIYPFWCSGWSGPDHNTPVVIAYVDNLNQIKEFWPDAFDLDPDEGNEILINSRFPLPEWYNGPLK